MTKEQHIEFWNKSASDDLISVTTLFESKRFVHALFFAHLALEKLCKAHWVKDNNENIPPKTHNIRQSLKTRSLIEYKI